MSESEMKKQPSLIFCLDENEKIFSEEKQVVKRNILHLKNNIKSHEVPQNHSIQRRSTAYEENTELDISVTSTRNSPFQELDVVCKQQLLSKAHNHSSNDQRRSWGSAAEWRGSITSCSTQRKSVGNVVTDHRESFSTNSSTEERKCSRERTGRGANELEESYLEVLNRTMIAAREQFNKIGDIDSDEDKPKESDKEPVITFVPGAAKVKVTTRRKLMKQAEASPGAMNGTIVLTEPIRRASLKDSSRKASSGNGTGTLDEPRKRGALKDSGTNELSGKGTQDPTVKIKMNAYMSERIKALSGMIPNKGKARNVLAKMINTQLARNERLERQQMAAEDHDVALRPRSAPCSPFASVKGKGKHFFPEDSPRKAEDLHRPQTEFLGVKSNPEYHNKYNLLMLTLPDGLLHVIDVTGAVQCKTSYPFLEVQARKGIRGPRLALYHRGSYITSVESPVWTKLEEQYQKEARSTQPKSFTTGIWNKKDVKVTEPDANDLQSLLMLAPTSSDTAASLQRIYAPLPVLSGASTPGSGRTSRAQTPRPVAPQQPSPPLSTGHTGRRASCFSRTQTPTDPRGRSPSPAEPKSFFTETASHSPISLPTVKAALEQSTDSLISPWKTNEDSDENFLPEKEFKEVIEVSSALEMQQPGHIYENKLLSAKEENNIKKLTISSVCPFAQQTNISKQRQSLDIAIDGKSIETVRYTSPKVEISLDLQPITIAPSPPKDSKTSGRHSETSGRRLTLSKHCLNAPPCREKQGAGFPSRFHKSNRQAFDSSGLLYQECFPCKDILSKEESLRAAEKLVESGFVPYLSIHKQKIAAASDQSMLDNRETPLNKSISISDLSDCTDKFNCLHREESPGIDNINLDDLMNNGSKKKGMHTIIYQNKDSSMSDEDVCPDTITRKRNCPNKSRSVFVLLIDSNSENCLHLQQNLATANPNIHCFSANSAKEAVSLIGNLKFDIVFLNWFLNDPQITVEELCVAVRVGNGVGKNIRLIVYMSSEHHCVEDENFLDIMREVGATDFLPKPYTHAVLTDLLKAF